MLGRSRGGGRAANRAADPEFAAWVDGMRARFGATLTRVEWPDGRTWGEADKGRWMNADEWIDYVNDPNPRPLGVQ